MEGVIAAGVSLLFVVGLTSLLVGRARRRERVATASLVKAKEQNLHLPPSLHPVIDPDICIGSYSCLRACPEGDILGAVDGKASLITAANCIGHGKCALECPVGAIRLVFGTSERGVDLPEVDEHFESSRAGVHVVGELGGMGLIKNAITQGLQVSGFLGKSLGNRARPDNELVDVAIVGAGPAGLATALGCRERGLSFRVLEQSSVGGTIFHYPRQKVVMTETVELPGFGKFGKRLISKEELLGTWQKAIAKSAVTVEEGVKVTGIEGEDGGFTLFTNQQPVRARKVVLATGRRGSPRKLGVPGEEREKVSYGLIDPEQYERCRVLVVGGGDAALEAAIQLCEEAGAEVTLSYRGAALGKCREANRNKLDGLAKAKKVKLLLPSTVERIEAERVVLNFGEQRVAIANDYVIVNIGGELPLEFLKNVGVGLRRYRGEALGEAHTHEAHTHEAKPRRPKKSARELEEDQKTRRFAWTLFALGALIVAYLAWVGGEYYLLPKAERLAAPGHETLRPAGTWGHGVGIVATLFMLSNFLYAVRKRWSFLKGTAPIRRWLTFHMFVGFMSPLVIAFHAAFQSNNLLATGTAGALLIVVGTGVVGRFIFGLVPTREGKAVQLDELTERWERLKNRVSPLLAGVSERDAVEAVLAQATAPPTRGSLPALLLRMPFSALRTSNALRRLKPLFPSADHHAEFTDAYRQLDTLRTQVGFYSGFKRLLSVWRVLHVVLAVFLVFVIAAHVGLSLYLGYGWIFF